MTELSKSADQLRFTIFLVLNRFLSMHLECFDPVVAHRHVISSSLYSILHIDLHITLTSELPLRIDKDSKHLKF